MLFFIFQYNLIHIKMWVVLYEVLISLLKKFNTGKDDSLKTSLCSLFLNYYSYIYDYDIFSINLPLERNITIWLVTFVEAIIEMFY